MAILCTVNVDTAREYKGLTLSTKYNGKKHKVYFKLVCSDDTIAEGLTLARNSTNILMIDYQGFDSQNEYYKNITSTDVYVGRLSQLGSNLDESDIERVLEDTPSGVVPIIDLPEDFNDMHLLWQLSKRYPTVRFCGGNLFSIDGVKVGAIGIDILEKHNIKYDESNYLLNNTADVLEVVDVNSLEIDTSSKPEKASKPREKKSSSDSSAKKTSSTSMKKKSFQDLLAMSRM